MSAQPASLVRSASNAAWSFARNVNAMLPKGQLPQPSWAPSPDCNREAADAVANGQATIADFRDKPGIIEAEILEEAGCILMRKACEKHGPFEDRLSDHPEFFRRMESRLGGR